MNDHYYIGLDVHKKTVTCATCPQRPRGRKALWLAALD